MQICWLKLSSTQNANFKTLLFTRIRMVSTIALQIYITEMEESQSYEIRPHVVRLEV